MTGVQTCALPISLADRWAVADGGTRITFHLRDGARFSDGTPIGAADVRRSWARLLDPDDPSPLASMLAEIVGAREILAGTAGPDALAVTADGEDVVVRLRRPTAWFVAAAGSTPLAIVPPAIGTIGDGPLPADFPVTGAWRPRAIDPEGIDLVANPAWWGGTPGVPTVRIATDGGGRTAVDRFRDGSVDWTPIPEGDARWIRWNAALGPSLRWSADRSVSLLLFDTTRPPFDSVATRRAVALAVDWERIARLAGGRPATSIVPDGIPGRPDGSRRLEPDPERARADLAAAGYPAGAGFPPIVLAGGGAEWEVAIARELEAVLGIRVEVQTVPFDDPGLDRGPLRPALRTME